MATKKNRHTRRQGKSRRLATRSGQAETAGKVIINPGHFWKVLCPRPVLCVRFLSLTDHSNGFRVLVNQVDKRMLLCKLVALWTLNSETSFQILLNGNLGMCLGLCPANVREAFNQVIIRRYQPKDETHSFLATCSCSTVHGSLPPSTCKPLEHCSQIRDYAIGRMRHR